MEYQQLCTLLWISYLCIYLFVFCALVPDCVLKSFLCVTWTAQSLIVVQHPVLPNCHAVVLTWSGLQLQPFLVDLHEQYVKWYVQTKYCVSSCFWKHNCIEKILYINQGVWLQIISIFGCSMFGIIYHRHLFQRKKRSLSSKKKMTRKPPSKTKPKPLKAKKYSTKKKHQMPGYQATAPEQHRGDIRVKIHFEIGEHPIKIFPPWILKGKSVMADFSLANLLSVEVAATSVSLRRPQQITSSLSFYANLYSSLLFSTWLR